MSSSQKEFIVGCLVGGILAAAGALLLPKNLLNSFVPLESRARKKSPHLNGSHHSDAHATHTARQSNKTISKRSVKTKRGAASPM